MRAQLYKNQNIFPLRRNRDCTPVVAKQEAVQEAVVPVPATAVIPKNIVLICHASACNDR